MTEKTLKHELYKHGSYLISLKESGSEFVNIDDEIKKNEELFQMASKKDHQPAFAVGEYYVSRTGIVYLITDVLSDHKVYTKSLIDGELSNTFIETDGVLFKNSTPAAAEQIATFRRAEHFASKGRKLDEFRVGDLVLIGGDKVCVKNISSDEWLTAVNKSGGYKMRKSDSRRITLIQTAEELQEVGDNE